MTSKAKPFVSTIMNVQDHIDRATFSRIDPKSIIRLAVFQMARNAGLDHGATIDRICERAVANEAAEFAAMGEYTANIRDYPNGAPGSALEY